MARNRLAKKVVDVESGTVTIEFTGGRKVVCDVGALPETMVRRSALHGLSQKLGDSFAGAENEDEAVTAAEATLKNLLAGEWATRGVGGEGQTTILVEALFRATQHEGKTMEDCEALVAEMTDEQKKGIKAVPQIKMHMDKIALERAMARSEKSARDAADKPLDLSAILG